MKYRYLMFLGITIRLALMPFLAHPFDMSEWYRYVDDIIKHGFSISALGINPLWNSLLVVNAYIYNWLSNILSISVTPVSSLPANFDPGYKITIVTDPLFNTLVKLPLIIADVFSTLLIYRIAYFYTKDYSVSWRSAMLYFFSPIVIWISAAWGQYDSLTVLFTLLSIYFLMVSKRIFASSFSLCIAVLIKIYPIIFLVPIIISILRFETDKVRKVMCYLLIFIPLSMYLVLFQENELLKLLNGMIFPSGVSFTNGFGLTYWSVSLIMSTDIFWSSTIMNLIMISLISLSLYYVIWRAKTQFTAVMFGSFLFTAALFLSLLVVTEQRSLILLALLSLIVIKFPSIQNYLIILSFTAFLYTQKNFPFYLLPIASKFPSSFSFLFSSMSPFINRSSNYILPAFNAGLILFIIGFCFSSILVILVYKIFRFKIGY